MRGDRRAGPLLPAERTDAWHADSDDQRHGQGLQGDADPQSRDEQAEEAVHDHGLAERADQSGKAGPDTEKASST